MKGRKPHWQWGVAQVAVVGEPVSIGADEHVKDATERIMHEIRTSVARARELYPQHPGPNEGSWWVRTPESALVGTRGDAS
jgi:hypothetical protein